MNLCVLVFCLIDIMCVSISIPVYFLLPVSRHLCLFASLYVLVGYVYFIVWIFVALVLRMRCNVHFENDISTKYSTV